MNDEEFYDAVETALDREDEESELVCLYSIFPVASSIHLQVCEHELFLICSAFPRGLET